MPADSPRILELRRRVQLDPASIAFAQLAEECRRAGSNEEAVAICRAGLARNHGYLSARVTLGRALTELGQLDEAKAELDIVVAGVPDNLAAIRGLAEILQRRGQMKEALEYYKRALELAKHDPDLEDAVERISQAVAPAVAPQAAGPQVSIEEIFNFDTLITQLGLPPEEPTLKLVEEPSAPELVDAAPASEGGPAIEDATVPSLEELFAEPTPLEVTAPVIVEEAAPAVFGEQDSVEDSFAEIAEASASAAEGRYGETSPELVEELPTSEGGPILLQEETPLEDFVAENSIEPALEAVTETPLESVELKLDDADSLAVMERELREREQQRTYDEQRARVALAQRRRAAMIGALETWLAAIVADRERHSA